jgi:hypothetical protein
VKASKLNAQYYKLFDKDVYGEGFGIQDVLVSALALNVCHNTLHETFQLLGNELNVHSYAQPGSGPKPLRPATEVRGAPYLPLRILGGVGKNGTLGAHCFGYRFGFGRLAVCIRSDRHRVAARQVVGSPARR